MPDQFQMLSGEVRHTSNNYSERRAEMFQLPLPSQLFRLAIRNPAFDLFLRLPSDRNSPDTVNPYIIHLLVTKNYEGRSPLWGYAAKFTPIDDAQSTTDPRLPVREGRAEKEQ